MKTIVAKATDSTAILKNLPAKMLYEGFKYNLLIEMWPELTDMKIIFCFLEIGGEKLASRSGMPAGVFNYMEIYSRVVR